MSTQNIIHLCLVSPALRFVSFENIGIDLQMNFRFFSLRTIRDELHTMDEILRVPLWSASGNQDRLLQYRLEPALLRGG